MLAGSPPTLSAGASANKPWHSTAIVERVTATAVKTASGSLYVLEGPTHAEPPTNAGMASETLASTSPKGSKRRPLGIEATTPRPYDWI